MYRYHILPRIIVELYEKWHNNLDIGIMEVFVDTYYLKFPKKGIIKIPKKGGITGI